MDLVDRVKLIPAPDGRGYVAPKCWLFLSFASAGFSGSAPIVLAVTAPDGTRGVFYEGTLEFDPLLPVNTNAMPMDWCFPEPGYYWFEVLLAGEVKSKTGLRGVAPQPLP